MSAKRRVRPAQPRPSRTDMSELLFTADAFEPIVISPKPRWDDDIPDPEDSTYPDAEHGPSPVPGWVITDAIARQYEVGRLKSGKEADVDLVERRAGDRRNVIATKRYRDARDRLFRNDATYRGARASGDRRIDRAVQRGTDRGMRFRAHLWAGHEFETLCRLWSVGAPVPYPIQRQGTELMLEYLGDDVAAGPRLVDARPGAAQLRELCDQGVEMLRTLIDAEVVHADLSPYNTLVWQDRLYVLDFPQAVHPNDPHGPTLLQRDVENLFGWFARQGVACDPDAIFADLIARVRM